MLADGVGEQELLRLAGAVETNSEHPLAEATLECAQRRGVDDAVAKQFENVPGRGATAEVDGRRVAVGSLRLMQRDGIELGGLAKRRDELAAGGRTAVLVAVDGRAMGIIGIADVVRDSSPAAVAALHEGGSRW